MRIDASESFAFSFIYGNTQFGTKTQSTCRMKKVDSSLLVRLHYTEAFKIAHARLTCLCLSIGSRQRLSTLERNPIIEINKFPIKHVSTSKSLGVCNRWKSFLGVSY